MKRETEHRENPVQPLNLWREGAGDDDRVGRIMAGMSLRDKIAQMMFFSPRSWKDESAPDAPAADIRELNETLRQYVRESRFGGMLLFGQNCKDAEQTLRLVMDLQSANRAGGGLPMFTAVDQEGGSVVRLAFGTSGVGNMALAATGDPENARRMARVHGEELALLGIDVNFAPDADVNDNPANPIIGVRAFSDDARVAGEYACAYVRGLHDVGILATIKHFPGHGNTDVDSHTGLPLVNRSRGELMANELIPFRAAIDAGADMVMTAHIQYPQVEAQTYTSISTGREVYIPATMSRTILTDMLRGELGFEGLIVTDDLEMLAIWDNFAIDDMLAMTINAGADMLLLPGIWGVDALKLIDHMLDRAVALTEERIIDAGRVDDSVRRILALKHRCGLLARDDFAVTDERIAAARGCGGAERAEIAWDMACRALTLLKNENGALPIRIRTGEKALILFTSADDAGAGEYAAWRLKRLGALPEGAEIECGVIKSDTAEACIVAARAADHAIIVSCAWSAGCLDPATEDGYPVGVARRIIADRHAAGKSAAVISAMLPYDAACYHEADAILLAYCASEMRAGQIDAICAGAGEGSAYVPNLPAALFAAFGAANPGGTLPVNLPALDADFRFTGETLFPSGSGRAGA